VHGRTVKQRYVGPSRWAFLAEVKRRYPHKTILGSGDVFTAPDAVRMVRETGVDGVWVARGSIGAPWIFRQIDALFRTGDRGPPPSLDDQRRAVTLHFAEAVKHYGEERGARIFRKFGIKYGEAHPLAAQVREAFCECKVPADVAAVVAKFYDSATDYGPVEHKDGPGLLIAAGATLTSCG
jgi:tRNA-dihydrouridine synthase